MTKQAALDTDSTGQAGAFDDEIPEGLAEAVALIEREVWAWEASDELCRPFAIRLAAMLAADPLN